MKRRIVNISIVMATLIMTLIICTGCGKNSSDQEPIQNKVNNQLGEKDFNKSMTEINSININALVEGGSHKTYNINNDDKKELEQIAKNAIKFNETDSSQIKNSDLNIEMCVYCNDGQVCRFLMGKEKIYLEVEWINDTTRKMYEIVDNELFNWVDNVIKKCEDTDNTIVKFWLNK